MFGFQPFGSLIERHFNYTRLEENRGSKKTDAGADPALVRGGGANSLDGSTDPIYFIDFLKNPTKLKKFWSMGGGGRAPGESLRSVTETDGRKNQSITERNTYLYAE